WHDRSQEQLKLLQQYLVHTQPFSWQFQRATLHEICKSIELREVKAGQRVICEDDDGEAVFLVSAGSLAVFKHTLKEDKDHARKVIAAKMNKDRFRHFFRVDGKKSKSDRPFDSICINEDMLPPPPISTADVTTKDQLQHVKSLRWARLTEQIRAVRKAEVDQEVNRYAPNFPPENDILDLSDEIPEVKAPEAAGNLTVSDEPARGSAHPQALQAGKPSRGRHKSSLELGGSAASGARSKLPDLKLLRIHRFRTMLEDSIEEQARESVEDQAPVDPSHSFLPEIGHFLLDLEPGDIFGEGAVLLDDHKHKSTVIAREDSEVLVLRRGAYNMLLTGQSNQRQKHILYQPSYCAKMMEKGEEERSPVEIKKLTIFTSAIPFFAKLPKTVAVWMTGAAGLCRLPKTVAAKLAQLMQIEVHAIGSIVTRQGTKGDSMFIIKQGECCVHVDKQRGHARNHAMASAMHRVIWSDKLDAPSGNEPYVKSTSIIKGPKLKGRHGFRRAARAIALMASISKAVREIGQYNKRRMVDKYGPIVRTMKTGECFGEAALQDHSGQRLATVVTAEPTQLLRVMRRDYEVTLAVSQHDELNERLDFLTSVAVLAQPEPLISSWLNPHYLEKLDFVRGNIMIKQNEPAKGLYIILKGDVCLTSGQQGPSRVEAAAGGTQQEVATLGAHDYFGEETIKDQGGHSHTVVAATAVSCLRLSPVNYPMMSQRTLELISQYSQIRKYWRANLYEEADSKHVCWNHNPRHVKGPERSRISRTRGIITPQLPKVHDIISGNANGKVRGQSAALSCPPAANQPPVLSQATPSAAVCGAPPRHMLGVCSDALWGMVQLVGQPVDDGLSSCSEGEEEEAPLRSKDPGQEHAERAVSEALKMKPGDLFPGAPPAERPEEMKALGDKKERRRKKETLAGSELPLSPRHSVKVYRRSKGQEGTTELLLPSVTIPSDPHLAALDWSAMNPGASQGASADLNGHFPSVGAMAPGLQAHPIVSDVMQRMAKQADQRRLTESREAHKEFLQPQPPSRQGDPMTAGTDGLLSRGSTRGSLRIPHLNLSRTSTANQQPSPLSARAPGSAAMEGAELGPGARTERDDPTYTTQFPTILSPRFSSLDFFLSDVTSRQWTMGRIRDASPGVVRALPPPCSVPKAAERQAPPPSDTVQTPPPFDNVQAPPPSDTVQAPSPSHTVPSRHAGEGAATSETLAHQQQGVHQDPESDPNLASQAEATPKSVASPRAHRAAQKEMPSAAAASTPPHSILKKRPLPPAAKKTPTRGLSTETSVQQQKQPSPATKKPHAPIRPGPTTANQRREEQDQRRLVPAKKHGKRHARQERHLVDRTMVREYDVDVVSVVQDIHSEQLAVSNSFSSHASLPAASGRQLDDSLPQSTRGGGYVMNAAHEGTQKFKRRPLDDFVPDNPSDLETPSDGSVLEVRKIVTSVRAAPQISEESEIIENARRIGCTNGSPWHTGEESPSNIHVHTKNSDGSSPLSAHYDIPLQIIAGNLSTAGNGSQCVGDSLHDSRSGSKSADLVT
ncbi:hypothetical protein CYMTET_43853, partial [Cymbomonas tetramitiformis]